MHYRKSLISVFQDSFASIDKISTLAGRLQLVYTMFISNNRVSFDLWWKENLLRYKKISEFYENGCWGKNFSFMLLLKPCCKDNQIWNLLFKNGWHRLISRSILGAKTLHTHKSFCKVTLWPFFIYSSKLEYTLRIIVLHEKNTRLV